MAVNFNNYYITFIDIAKKAVGSKLSKGGQSGNDPNVARVRLNSASPPYPFVTVEVRDAGNVFDGVYSSYIDDNGKTVTTRTKHFFITYNAYGSNAMEIISGISSEFDKGSTKLKLITDLPEAAYKRVWDIKNIPITPKDTTQWIEHAEVSVELHVADTVIDELSYDIADVEFTSEVFVGEVVILDSTEIMYNPEIPNAELKGGGTE